MGWVLLYYVGTVVLHMSEDVFWKSTLRKVHAVFKWHCEHMPKPASKKRAVTVELCIVRE